MDAYSAFEKLISRVKYEVFRSFIPLSSNIYGDEEDVRLLSKQKSRKGIIPGQSWLDKKRENDHGFFVLKIVRRRSDIS